MKFQESYQHTTTTRSHRLPLLPLLFVFILSVALIPVSHAGGQQTGDVRPRRTGAASPQATPTPVQKATPAVTTTTTKTPATQLPKQTPTPTPAPSPVQQGAPKLQTAPVTKSDQKTDEEKEQEIDPEEVIRVESNLVNLQVRVIDRNNRPLPDVSKNDFQVFENGVAQKIEFVETEEVPISYGLVIDNSGSIRHQISDVIEAGKTIVNGNKPGDEGFVIRFIGSDNITTMKDFTTDKQALNDALDDMYIEGGQTAVIDAVYLAAEHAAEYKKGGPLDDKRRRALILVTDGEDRASVYKTEQLFESLKEEDVQIFVIGFVNELDKEGGFIRKSKRQQAVNLLDRMAKDTGGRAFYPNSLTELPGIAQEITKDLRTQYVISYIPTSKARPGEFRPVRVAVADAPNHDKRIAVTRSGYTAKGDNAIAPPATMTPTPNKTTTPPPRRP